MASLFLAAFVFAVCFCSGNAIQMPVNKIEQQACSFDASCQFSSEKSKCCPIDGTFTYGCPVGVTYLNAPAANCSSPGAASSKPLQCTCVEPEPCLYEGGKPFANWPYEAAKPGMKQWLMVGDSISWGLLRPAKEESAKLGIQLLHSPTNAKNLWWGAKCMDQWFGEDPKRWDVISFNFGLHDLAMSLERLEPKLYGEMLTKFVHILHKTAPSAALVWATTTPAPDGSERACDPKAFNAALPTWGGCPPRLPSDVILYNEAAAEALAATRLNVVTADLYSSVTKRCGKQFAACEGFQKPMEVHFDVEGNDLLGKDYAEVVAAVINQ